MMYATETVLALHKARTQDRERARLGREEQENQGSSSPTRRLLELRPAAAK